MFSVVRLALEKTGSKNLCLAGGVALNSKSQWKNRRFPASLKNSSCNPPLRRWSRSRRRRLAPFLDAEARLPLRAMRHAYLGPVG